MRKIVIAFIGALALASLPASANDAQDAKACRTGGDQATVQTVANGTTEADRLAVCVHQGGMTVFYFGGEMQSEDPRNDGFGGTCGAVIVADTNVAQGAYGEDWDRTDPSHPNNFHC